MSCFATQSCLSLGLLLWGLHRCNPSAPPDMPPVSSHRKKKCFFIQLPHWLLCLAGLAQNMSKEMKVKTRKNWAPEESSQAQWRDSQLPRMWGTGRPIHPHNALWTDIRILKNKMATVMTISWACEFWGYGRAGWGTWDQVSLTPAETEAVRVTWTFNLEDLCTKSCSCLSLSSHSSTARRLNLCGTVVVPS